MEGLLLALVVFVLVCFMVDYKEKSDKGYEWKLSLKHIDGIPGINKGIDTEIYIYENKLMFDSKQVLPFSRIKKTEVISQKQITEKQKSVIGRAIAGGALLGGLGAIIGSISGTGKKEVQEDVYMLSIYFTDKNGVDTNALFLLNWGVKGIAKQLSETINKKIGYNQKNITSYEI